MNDNRSSRLSATRRRLRSQRLRTQRTRGPRNRSTRRGSTLVVVISLLALLSILGVTINLFTQQAAVTAMYMSEGAKVREDPRLDPNVILDFALEQLILGPSDAYPQSALFGGRHSLLPNMFGRDIHPFSGRGINLVDLNGDGLPDLDQNFNGQRDVTESLGNDYLKNLNNSFAVTGAMDANLTSYPEPDPEYTRPDINATWLGHVGYGLDSGNRPVLSVIPSFHRPQYLRSAGTWKPIRAWDTDPLTANKVLRPHSLHVLAGNPAIKRFIHPSEGTANPFPFGPRDNGVWNMQGYWEAGRAYTAGDWLVPGGGEPNPRGLFFRAKTTGTSGMAEPVWSNGNAGDDLAPADGGVTWTAYKFPAYEYDADPNKDGIKEGVYLDLGFPVQEFNGELFIPLISFHIEDADQRVNLNATGNAEGRTNVGETNRPFGFRPDGAGGGQLGPLHESNHGLTPYEINLSRILTADPSTLNSDDFDRLNVLFGTNRFGPGTDYRELANTELFTLLKGLPHVDSSGNVTQRNEGRLGELDRSINGYANKSNVKADYAQPGISGVDDEANRNFGESIVAGRVALTGYNVDDWTVSNVDIGLTGLSATVFLLCTQSGTTGATAPMVDRVNPGYRFMDGTVEWMIFQAPFGTYRDAAFGHPYDVRGTGFIRTAPNQLQVVAAGPNRWLQHGNTATQGFNKWFLAGQNANPQLNLLGFEAWVPAAQRTNQLLDDAMETFTTNANGDSPFPPGDNAFLMHSPTIQATSGTSSRLAALGELNLVKGNDAVARRKRLTAISWDLRTRGIPPTSLQRTWEFTNGKNFPPAYAAAALGTDPFRPALRQYLAFQAETAPAGTSPLTAVTQRLLSANHVVDLLGPGADGAWGTGDDDTIENDPTEWPHLRRLTTHPARTGKAPIGTKAVGSMTLLERNEYEARKDRQLLARDIYVLLYTFCGGTDLDANGDPLDYTAEANALLDPINSPGIRQLYNDDQTTAMAQFAVNLVDAMDPDDVITKFEFDRNLFDGWNLDDNAYGNSINDPAEGTGDRGVVFGVEAQTLTFSETLAFQAVKMEVMGTGVDNARTAHNDTEHRDWTYLELRNASPHAVGFENEAWKIVVQPKDKASAKVNTRHLIVKQGGVAGGGLFTIGTAGDDHLKEGVRPKASHFEADNSVTGPLPLDPLDPTGPLGPGTMTRFVPPAGAPGLDLDLVIDTHEGRFRIHESAVVGVDTSDPPQGSVNPGELGPAFDNSNNKGDLLSLPDPDQVQGDPPVLEFVLMRRAHPYREAPVANTGTYGPESNDNPWIEVDRTTTQMKVFGPLQLGLAPPVAKAEIDQQLAKIISSERSEPFIRDESELANGTSAPATTRNTLSVTNAATTSAFRVLQLHFDRDFTSPIEFFNIPMFGPKDTTHPRRGLTNVVDFYPLGAFPNMAGPQRFLRPVAPGAYGADNLPGNGGVDDDGNTAFDDWRERGQGDDPDPDPANDASATYTYKYDNRWSRLLGLVGTPSPMINVTNTTIDQGQYRLPGKLNWNTLSYPEVLAALLDEDAAFKPFSTSYAAGFSYPLKPGDTNKQQGYLADASPAEQLARDWWVEFLASRDGVDGLTGLALQGAAAGRPFRSPTFLTSEPNDPSSIEHTMLRGLFSESVNSTVPGRRLFELGTAEQRYGSSPPDPAYNGVGGHLVDLHTRHEVLSRAWANSTTRSNALNVYVQIDFFEVVNVGTGPAPIYRIGGRKPGMPTHRGFVVIDRSLAYTKLKAEHLRPIGDPGQSKFSIRGSSEGGFDFRDVIVHRELIE